MKLLLFGRSGQVGRELQRSLLSLGHVVACGRERADLADPESLRALILDERPDVIVNAAAYTAVDRAESERELAITVNAESPCVMAETGRDIGSLLVHYSTDYVFDGGSEHPYVESDKPAPRNVYGESKLEGEQRVISSGCDYLVFRTSWVYASHGNNFLRTILRLAKERAQLGIVDDQVGTPTWAAMIADVTAIALCQAAREREVGAFRSDLYHLVARGQTSWYGFASQVLAEAESLGLSTEFRLEQLDAITTADYPTPAARPPRSVLAVEHIERSFGLMLPEWRQSLSLCMREVRRP